jgi:hypothetical protein
VSTEKPIRDWLKALGTLTAGTMQADEADAKLRAYAPLLSQQFRPTAFTAPSLEHVASQCRFFPSYAEVVKYLGEYVRDHPQTIPALAGPGPVLDVIDRAWVAYWQKRRTEDFAPYGNSPGGRAHVASLIRQQSPKAWHVIENGRA